MIRQMLFTRTLPSYIIFHRSIKAFNFHLGHGLLLLSTGNSSLGAGEVLSLCADLSAPLVTAQLGRQHRSSAAASHRARQNHQRPVLNAICQSAQANAFWEMKHSQKPDAVFIQKWVWTWGETLFDVQWDHKALDFQGMWRVNNLILVRCFKLL